jgi:hypothetical protein
MARSTYIYVVLWPSMEEVYGAFTVKNEMIAALEKENIKPSGILRLRDGLLATRVWLSP